jgi:hypothetical protein
MTALEKLIDLQEYIKTQLYLEEAERSYNGTQKAIAYKRVLLRLNPIVSGLKRVKNQIEGLPEPQPGPEQKGS